MRVPHVRVIDEARKGLVVARETGRLAATGDVLVYLGADCRAPLAWLASIERRFLRSPDLLALSGPYRYYDWDWWGRLLIRAYDVTLAPATQFLVKRILRMGSILYGGNFACRHGPADPSRDAPQHDHRPAGRQRVHREVPLRRDRPNGERRSRGRAVAGQLHLRQELGR